MKTLSSTGFALLGAGLVAISYGLARFAFGLFVPPIRAELDLSSYEIGIIGALPLVSFVLAMLVASFSANRLGARSTALIAGGFGVAGLSLISQAPNALALGVGVFACGICTGLMMPALTAAMQVLVNRAVHGRVSSVMNAGTSVGVIIAVPTILFLEDAWRLAYMSFAALAGIGLVATWVFIPSVSRIIPSTAAPPPPISALQWWRLLRLSAFAFAMGFLSAPYWIFAPDLVVTLGALPSGETGWLWLAVGIAGLGGAVVTDLADRNNPPVTHALMLMMLSTSLALLAASPAQLTIAAYSGLVFGLAYMSLTGLYLLTGIRLLPGRLSVGPVLPFIAVALGQAAGSPIIGEVVGQFGYADGFAMFAAAGVLVALLSPLYPRYIDAAPEEPREQAEEYGLQAAYDQQLTDEEGQPLEIEPAEKESSAN